LATSIPLELWRKSQGADLVWEASPQSARLPVSLSFHAGDPTESLKLDDCGVRADFGVGAFFESTPLTCRKIAPPVPDIQGLERKSDIVQLMPAGTPLARKATLTFPLAPDSANVRALGVYRLEGPQKEWSFLGGTPSPAGLAIPIGRLDTYALLED